MNRDQCLAFGYWPNGYEFHLINDCIAYDDRFIAIISLSFSDCYDGVLHLEDIPLPGYIYTNGRLFPVYINNTFITEIMFRYSEGLNENAPWINPVFCGMETVLNILHLRPGDVIMMTIYSPGIIEIRQLGVYEERVVQIAKEYLPDNVIKSLSEGENRPVIKKRSRLDQTGDKKNLSFYSQVENDLLMDGDDALVQNYLELQKNNPGLLRDHIVNILCQYPDRAIPEQVICKILRIECDVPSNGVIELLHAYHCFEKTSEGWILNKDYFPLIRKSEKQLAAMAEIDSLPEQSLMYHGLVYLQAQSVQSSGSVSFIPGKVIINTDEMIPGEELVEGESYYLYVTYQPSGGYYVSRKHPKLPVAILEYLDPFFITGHVKVKTFARIPGKLAILGIDATRPEDLEEWYLTRDQYIEIIQNDLEGETIYTYDWHFDSLKHLSNILEALGFKDIKIELNKQNDIPMIINYGKKSWPEEWVLGILKELLGFIPEIKNEKEEKDDDYLPLEKSAMKPLKVDEESVEHLLSSLLQNSEIGVKDYELLAELGFSMDEIARKILSERSNINQSSLISLIECMVYSGHFETAVYSLQKYPKFEEVPACRLARLMYGFIENDSDLIKKAVKLLPDEEISFMVIDCIPSVRVDYLKIILIEEVEDDFIDEIVDSVINIPVVSIIKKCLKVGSISREEYNKYSNPVSTLDKRFLEVLETYIPEENDSLKRNNLAQDIILQQRYEQKKKSYESIWFQHDPRSLIKMINFYYEDLSWSNNKIRSPVSNYAFKRLSETCIEFGFFHGESRRDYVISEEGKNFKKADEKTQWLILLKKILFYEPFQQCCDKLLSNGELKQNEVMYIFSENHIEDKYQSFYFDWLYFVLTCSGAAEFKIDKFMLKT